MQQLTIFEVINEFDETKCNWVDVLGDFEKCTVLAMIPAGGFSPLENPFKSRSNEYQKAEKIWRDYTFAIYLHVGSGNKSWSIACNRFRECRDNNEPCLMVINRAKHGDNFKPSQVIDYV